MDCYGGIEARARNPMDALLKGVLGAREGRVSRREEAFIWQLLTIGFMRDIGGQLAWATQATEGDEVEDQVHRQFA